MVSSDLVAAKLAELAFRISRVRGRCPPEAEALKADADALDLVSFNLMLAVQICADTASHIIASEEWPVATNLAGAFNRLSERGVLSPSTAEALARAVGLRNVVAHGYQRVDSDMVFAAATRGLADLEAFATEVTRFLGSRS